MAEFYRNGKLVEKSWFISEDDARLKALALNWNCLYIDHKGNRRQIV